MDQTQCPFCDPHPENLWFEDEYGRVIWDAFPLSKGHTLIVPKLHVASLFDLEPKVQTALWKLVAKARNRLAGDLQPDGFNVGLNDGEAAGQTVKHVHIHVIPRWIGDVPDPKGGVRWIIPEKARYWSDE